MRTPSVTLTRSCLGLGLIAAAVIAVSQSTEKAHKITMISTRKMADSLHSVIAADRAAYVRLVVDRFATNSAAPDSNGLPTHAQLLRDAAVSIQQRGAEFSYALRSLWPINANHGPQTEAEQTGLEFVARNPGTNYYTEETLGGRSYFTAVYADTAVSPSCVDCHNRHSASPRKDFKAGDAMGGIVVRVPLEF